MNDKIQRLNTMYSNKQTESKTFDETVDDTIQDLINYAIYLQMLKDGGIE
jgi:hypothetical protein